MKTPKCSMCMADVANIITMDGDRYCESCLKDELSPQDWFQLKSIMQKLVYAGLIRAMPVQGDMPLTKGDS